MLPVARAPGPVLAQGGQEVPTHQWSMYSISAGSREILSPATSVADRRVHSDGPDLAVLPLKQHPCISAIPVGLPLCDVQLHEMLMHCRLMRCNM